MNKNKEQHNYKQKTNKLNYGNEVIKTRETDLPDEFL